MGESIQCPRRTNRKQKNNVKYGMVPHGIMAWAATTYTCKVAQSDREIHDLRCFTIRCNGVVKI
jgi:hypothetical protein